MPSQKDVAEIIGFIRATSGFTVAKTGNQKHYKVLKRGGGAVIHPDGKPIIISSSPSEERFKEMTIKRLIQAKVLEKDPYKATPTKGSARSAASSNGDAPKKKRTAFNDPERKAEIQRLKVAGIKAKSARQREQTAKLRGRFEPIVPNVGGWADKSVTRGERTRLTVTELADVATYWGTSRGRVEFPKDLKTGKPVEAHTTRGAAQTLKTPGATLGEKWLPFWEVFIDHLWAGAGTDAKKAAARYMELLREMKGIVTPPVAEGTVSNRPLALVPPSVVEAPPEPVFEKVGPAYDPDPPSLALETVFLMARCAENNFDQVMKAGERIARLELKQRREETK